MATEESAPQAGSFQGLWLVSEYVFAPNGSFAGVVHQRRQLESLGPGQVRVTQRCEPEDRLAGHAMGRFRGTYVFDVELRGRVRRYLGPDVVGTGLSHDSSVMTGDGLWPGFGHNFVSYAVLVDRGRQLTGGKFFNASEMVANIVGVAISAENGPLALETSVPDTSWPELAEPYRPEHLHADWTGCVRTVAANGDCAGDRPIRRHYSPDHQGWTDTDDDGTALDVRWQRCSDRLQIRLSSGLTGIGKQTGWLLEFDAFGANGERLQAVEIFDSASAHLAGIRHHWVDGTLTRREILRLDPLQPDAAIGRGNRPVRPD